ncbi:hypothetical protein [Cellulomonas sp. KRMCY2]|uniref:hypothetical protein n=1 Tax=Cellulomonas sp. KRMCY2 TaxID=1304865 RepID=UPI0012DE75A8|nr:hypothetical protein [Cellulomonas sp. KRMCY2]
MQQGQELISGLVLHQDDVDHVDVAGRLRPGLAHAARLVRGTRRSPGECPPPAGRREAIEARVTIVVAPLAVARYLQDTTGVTIKKLVQTLRPLRSVVIAIGDQTIPADPTPGPDARTILDQLPAITVGH